MSAVNQHALSDQIFCTLAHLIGQTIDHPVTTTDHSVHVRCWI